MGITVLVKAILAPEKWYEDNEEPCLKPERGGGWTENNVIILYFNEQDTFYDW